MRVLFLGIDLNPLSVRVLQALSRIDGLELAVAPSRPAGAGLVDAARRALRKHGALPVARGALRLVRAKLRLLARSCGLPLRSCASLEEVARERGLPLLALGRVSSPDAVARVAAWRPDVILVAAFDQILKPALLGVPRLGCVNLHPSLLPAYRGPNPFYWVLARGEASTGITYHQIDAGIDTGPILLQREVAIRPGETEWSLLARSADLACQVLPELIEGLRSETLKPRPQPAENASYFPQPPRGASTL